MMSYCLCWSSLFMIMNLNILCAFCILNINNYAAASKTSRLTTRKLKEDLPKYMSYDSMMKILSIDVNPDEDLEDEWDDVIEDTWDFAFELSEERDEDDWDCKTRDGGILSNLIGDGGSRMRMKEETHDSTLFMVCYSDQDKDYQNFSGNEDDDDDDDDDYDDDDDEYEYDDVTATNETDVNTDLTSGYQIASQIAGQIQSKARSGGMNTMHGLPVCNTPDATCFYAYLQASVAAEFKDMDHVSVTPLPHSLKIRANTLSLDIDDIEENSVETVTVAAQLCPSVGSSDTNAAEIGTSILQDMDFDECWDEAESLRESPMFLQHGMGLYTVFYELSLESLKSEECYNEFVVLLASASTIMSVEKIPDMELLNDHSQWILQSNKPEKRNWFDVGLTGEGQVVAISDSGLYTDSCYFWDSTGTVAKDTSGSFDLSRRKVVQYYASVDDRDDNGHGTHCAGTIAGRRSDNGIDPVTGFGDGVAKDAKLALFDIGRGTRGRLEIDFSNVYSAGRLTGAKIHSASWGGPGYGQYGAFENFVDEDAYNNEDFLIFYAAGNSGYVNPDRTISPDVMSSIATPALSKNVVAVGATESFGDNLASGMKGRDYLALFSSRGPALDGRIKPDIVAPGLYVLSAATNATECDPTERPIVGTDGPMGGLRFLAGTSMACPGAAGAGALVRQYFSDGFYPTGQKVAGDSMDIGGSLLKAIIMNGGQSILGVNNVPQFNASVTPSQMYDGHQGFGRVDLSKSLPLSVNGTLPFNAFVVDRESLADQETKTFMFPMCSNGMDFRVTLTWFDLPGQSGCLQCLVQDLDLKVKFAATEEPVFFPNGGSEKDTVNNVERVIVSSDDIMDGDVLEVSVSAANLASAMEKFSLAATGCFGEVVKDFTSYPEMKVDPMELLIGSSPVENDAPDSLKKMALSELVTRYIYDNI